MSTLRAKHYGEAVARLMQEREVIEMAGGLMRTPLDEIAHPDGTPRHGFMLAANREYAGRTGREPDAHLGGVAEALIALHKFLNDTADEVFGGKGD